MPASPRERLNPNTVHKGLQQVQPARSNLNARAMDSYAGVRPGEVARNYGAGASYTNLIRGLAVLEPALVGYLDKRLERQIEEGTAEGLNKFNLAGDVEANRNRMAYKEFIEKHPEYASDNPYVWKGWEKARLNSMALDYEKGLQDAYTNSGLQNETDLGKVKKVIDEYNKTFRQEHNLDAYPNPLDLARHFTQHAVKSRESLMARHTQDVKSQAEANLAMATMERAVKQIETLSGPVSKHGASIGLASQSGAAIERMHAVLSANLAEAAANGLRNSELPKYYTEAVFALYEKYGQNPVILKLLDREINGVRPTSLPNVQHKVNQLEEMRVSNAHAAWARGVAYRKHRREEEMRRATEMGYDLILSGALKDKGPITPDTALDDKGTTINSLNLSPTARFNMLKGMVAVQEEMGRGRKSSPQWEQAVVNLKIMAGMGALSLDEAAAWDMHLQTGGDISTAMAEASRRLDNNVRDATRRGASVLFKQLTGKTMESMELIISGMTDGAGTVSPLVHAGMAAVQMFQERMEKEIEDYKRKHDNRMPDNTNLERIQTRLVADMLKEHKPVTAVPENVRPPLGVSHSRERQQKVDAFLRDHLPHHEGRGLTENEVRTLLARTPGVLQQFDRFMNTGGDIR